MTSTLGIKKIQYPNGTNIATLDSSGSIAFAGASTVAGTLGVTGAITGTLATAAQTNITSVGTLTSFRSTGIDDNADALAMTIDNSERVLIGMTTASSSTDGIQFIKDGRIFSNVDGQLSTILNRKSSDGGIVEFRKDGSAIGSIGVEGGDSLFIQGGTSNGSGLLCHPTGAKVLPVRNATSIDATIDLGQNNRRFKDLYLSGGLLVGGTGAANTLDDYEEGSFTPALTAGTITNPDGRYVKIGKQVTVWIYAPTISDTSTASTLEITGLPFTSESTSLMDSTAGTVMLRYLDDGVAEPLTITSWMNGSDNKVRFYVNTGNGNSYSVVQYAHFSSNNVGIRVTHTYMAS